MSDESYADSAQHLDLLFLSGHLPKLNKKAGR